MKKLMKSYILPFQGLQQMQRGVYVFFHNFFYPKVILLHQMHCMMSQQNN